MLGMIGFLNVIVLTTTAFIATSATAQSTKNISVAAGELRHAMVQLENASANSFALSKTVSSTNSEIARYLAWIEKLPSDRDDIEPIVEQLRYYTSVLNQLRDEINETDTAPRLEKIQADARIKVKYGTEYLGVATKSPLVETSIRTKVEATNRERVHLTVGYVVDGLPLNDKRFRRVLPALTPILRHRILPGIYTFFAERSGNTIGRKTVELGFSGQVIESIEIPVSEE